MNLVIVNCRTVSEVVKNHTLAVLRECNNNRTRAAKILGWSRQTLYTKLKKWDIHLDWTDADGTPLD